MASPHKAIIEDENAHSDTQLIFHFDHNTSNEMSRTTTRNSAQMPQVSQSSATPTGHSNDGHGYLESNGVLVHTVSNFDKSQFAPTPATTVYDENDYDGDIDNDLALDQFDEMSSRQPQRFQFPRTQSNISAGAGALQRNSSIISSTTDVVHIHGDFEESQEMSRDHSNLADLRQHGINSPAIDALSMTTSQEPPSQRPLSINIHSSGSTIPVTTILGGGPSPDQIKRHLPPLSPVIPSTPTHSSTPRATVSPQQKHSPLTSTTTTTTTMAPVATTSLAEHNDRFPGDGRYRYGVDDDDDDDNNNNGVADDNDSDVERNQKKAKAVTLSSEDLEGLDLDDINNQLHNKFLPDWCNCFVSGYLHSSTIRRHAFQRPLDDRQILAFVIVMSSFILSIIVWFIAEPVLVVRVAFGLLWLFFVALIILMWVLISFIETQAYKLSNIPSNPEELYRLDKRLLEHGKAKMIEIQAKNAELNSSSSDSFANPPGTHHELAHFVPIRDTLHDYMTDTRFCCFLFRRSGDIAHDPSKPSSNHRAIDQYSIAKQIPQQRVPFWVKPYSYYLKLFGDMKTTIQYLRHDHDESSTTGNHHNPNAPHNSFSAQTTTLNGRRSSVALSINRDTYLGTSNDHMSQYGDVTDTQSVLSTLSQRRKQQLLISSNQFGLTHSQINDETLSQSSHQPSVTPIKTPRAINIHPGTPLAVPGTLSPPTPLPNSSSNQRDSLSQLRDSNGPSRGSPNLIDNKTTHTTTFDDISTSISQDAGVNASRSKQPLFANESPNSRGRALLRQKSVQRDADGSGAYVDSVDQVKTLQFRPNNDYDLSDGDDDGRVSTIQPLVSFKPYSAFRDRGPHVEYGGNSPQIRAHSLTPGQHRILRSKHHTVGEVELQTTTDQSHYSPENTVGDGELNLYRVSTPDTHRRGYSTLQPGDLANSAADTPMGRSHSISNHNAIGGVERGTLTQLRSNSAMRLEQVPQSDFILGDDTISVATHHNIVVLKSVHDTAQLTGQDKPSALDIVQSHELPVGTGTYQYEDVIIDTQQQLVPIEVTEWWPHHLLSMYELYQLTDVYYTPPLSMKTQYTDLITQLETHRLQTFSNNFRFTNLSAAPEHVFIGVSNKIRLNSRSGIHGSIGGERGYHNDEVCVMQEGELRMSYFNHFNHIISLPFHAGFLGNASFPAIPDVETPIPIFGVGIKESRPLQRTLQRNRNATTIKQAPGAATIADSQNVTTVVVAVDDANVPNPINLNSPSFATSASSFNQANRSTRGRGLQHETSFNQYSFVSKGDLRGESLQPVAVHTRHASSVAPPYLDSSSPHYKHHSLDHDSTAAQGRAQPSFMLATESFIRDGSTLMIGAQGGKRSPAQSFDPNGLPKLRHVGSDDTVSPKTFNLTISLQNKASNVGRQLAALTYVHPNQITANLQTKKLNAGATTQQRLYINTKRGPLICIDEPNHCQPHANDRGMIVASAKCVVDFDKRPVICKQCRIFQEPTMLHCTICNKCQEYFDHHCPYLNICVGERNYHVFFTLVFSVTMFSLLNFFLGIRSLLLAFDVDIFREVKSPLLSSGHYYEGHIFGTAWVALAILAALAILVNLIGIGAFGSLLSVHAYLVYTGTTTRALVQRWKQEKKEKRRAERQREKELEAIRVRKEEQRKEAEQQRAELEARKATFHPNFKPTKGGVSLAVKFNIDTASDIASLDQFRTQPRRQTIYHRKVSGVVPVTQPMPQYDNDGNVMTIVEEQSEPNLVLNTQQTKPKGSIFNKGRNSRA